MRHSTRSRAIALAFALLAVGLPTAARLVVGPQGAAVHVRWQESIDPAARQQLEARFHLADGRNQDDRTWRYDLTDVSPDNIRALVLDPAVADTHDINRPAASLEPSAARTARRQRFASGDLVVAAADWSALMLLAAAVLLITRRVPTARGVSRLLSPVFLSLRNTAGFARAAITGALVPWIPELDARALGAFRIALGCGFFWVVWGIDNHSIPFAHQLHLATPDLAFVHQIAASPRGCDAIELAMLVSALLFAMGLWTRWAYTGFVAAFFLHTLIKLESFGTHDLGLPLVTYIGWLTVPWGDGLSIDGWRRTRSGGGVSTVAPSRIYGFAIWWPGLTLGVGLLAAAYAKLAKSGLAWITGGAVRYHFVTDAGNAAVDWGLWVASHEWAAVLFSLAAFVLEAAFIVNVVARGPVKRLAAGAVGAGLFLGLYLFQGIFWRGWLVLFLAFLPWAWLNRPSRGPVSVPVAGGAIALRTPQVVAVSVLLCAQLYASAAQIEVEPLLSNFPMYSFTYSSPEDFGRSGGRWALTRLLEVQADGRNITDTVHHLSDDDRFALMDLAEQRMPQGERLAEDPRLSRGLLCERYQRAMGTLPAVVTVTMERQDFDWHAGRFIAYTPLPTSPIHLAALCQGLAVAATRHAG